jgi:glycosyltransferase involved in cell wall biosynthesis
MPTFNRAYCIANAIDSALGQSHPNVEVIIIDDGSTDGTRALIAARYAQDERVKYFAQHNQGVTAARNRGLARANGDFVALLDSDDAWKPWKLEVQLACMAHCPEIGMVWTDMEAVNDQGEITHAAYLRKMYSCHQRFTLDQLFTQVYPLERIVPNAPEPVRKARLYTGFIFSQMFMGSLVHTSTVLLRRERLEMVKGFNEELKLSGEDYDFHLRTCREGPVGFVDLSSIRYQIGMPDRLSHRRYMVCVLGNCLKTITGVIEREPERVELPASLIKERFAEVHAWLAEALLDAGERQQSRAHFLESFRYQLWQPRSLRLFALALMPPRVGDSVRAAYRRMKLGFGQTA